ncbi:uncharacterized protein K02A2.6-like [Pygocentrus nattereri]|uniref:uncharacterized protein K02A2.6-like n=1 Tax=Pygocentrus nattereri TaxID=42514 RepID=UPI00189193DA|nr:uncharacterized protein K02A2.6-like [Pygocentrus nattereri]
MEIDTGATFSIVSENVYKNRLKPLSLKPANIKLKTYTGEQVPVRGVVDVTVQLNKQTAKLPLYVVKGDYPSLLGRAWLDKITLDWPAIRMMVKEETGLIYILNKHADVFKDELGNMKNISVKLDTKTDAKPKFLKARPVPYAIHLKSLVQSGVLEPVSVSSWATPIVPVIKKDGSIRICGDFKVTLNTVLEVERYPLPHIDDLFAELAGGQKFSKIDLSQAYLQMNVDESSRELLTIITHKGLYRYRRLPYGVMSAPSLFQRAMDQILNGLAEVQCYLDDTLIAGKTEEEHLRNLDATLQRLKEHGVLKSKCEFFQPSVEYLGHVIDSQGLHKAPSKVKAIMEAPAPQNVSQLRSYLGLLNYYGRFVLNLASLLKPLHQLLCQDKAWKWTDKCAQAFAKTKRALLKSEVLTHFDPDLPLQLACDVSPYGVGAVISHIMPDGKEKPIAFASRTLNKAESNYAQIEREALGIVFGVRKFHQYLFGQKFTLLTDHRPLTTIFGPHVGIPSLAASRMQRWALLLSAHSYDIKYRKSELHANADGLSRLPLPVTHAEPKQAEIFYFQQVEDAPVTTSQVQRHTRNDPLLSKLLDMVVCGRNVEDAAELKPYLVRCNDLTVQAGCLLWGQRVIIPPSLRNRVLQVLHSGHCGIVRMKELARSYFWWPGLDGQIEETVSSCTSCQKVRNMPQLAPLHPWDWPEEPWQRVHIDFAGPFEEKMLLVAMDAYSKWPEVFIMKSTTTEKTIEKLGEMFSRFGFPEQLVSDNGPQFISQEFEKFLKVNGVQHIQSAPYHPSTNGLAERFVQSLKHSLKASCGQSSLHQRLNSFLLSYRNVPHSTTQVSPAILFMKRRLRTSLDLLKPSRMKACVQRQQQAQIERRKQRAKNRVFHPGDQVLACNYTRGPKWIPATVITKTGPVSYRVKTTEDIVWRRHTDQLLQGAAAPAESVSNQINGPKPNQPGSQHLNPSQQRSPAPPPDIYCPAELTSILRPTQLIRLIMVFRSLDLLDQVCWDWVWRKRLQDRVSINISNISKALLVGGALGKNYQPISGQ